MSAPSERRGQRPPMRMLIGRPIVRNNGRISMACGIGGCRENVQPIIPYSKNNTDAPYSNTIATEWAWWSRATIQPLTAQATYTRTVPVKWLLHQNAASQLVTREWITTLDNQLTGKESRI